MLLFPFFVLFITFDSTPGTRFWGGNIEGMWTCLFLGSALLNRVHHKRPEPDNMGAISPQPVKRLIHASVYGARRFGLSSLERERTQQLPENPVRFYSVTTTHSLSPATFGLNHYHDRNPSSSPSSVHSTHACWHRTGRDLPWECLHVIGMGSIEVEDNTHLRIC